MAHKVRAQEWFATHGLWFVWVDPETYAETGRSLCKPSASWRGITGFGRGVIAFEGGYSGPSRTLRVALVAFKDQPLTEVIAWTAPTFVESSCMFYMTIEGVP